MRPWWLRQTIGRSFVRPFRSTQVRGVFGWPRGPGTAKMSAMGVEEELTAAVAKYGRSVRDKLSAFSVTGQPEDQLRNPLESLLRELCELTGRDGSKLTLIGETSLASLAVRPDFAVEYDDLLIGFIEVKSPGKGADPRRFRDLHDKTQWKKLQALPNLLYTDGQEFALWCDGKQLGSTMVFIGDLETAGKDLAPPANLLQLVEDFFVWKPILPRSPAALATISARLCRLLRDEVAEQLDLKNEHLHGLLEDWKNLLFPEATEQQFADWYAQAVTFGLLLARAREIDLTKGVAHAARELSVSTDSMIGSALRALTDPTGAVDALQTSVATMGRVLAVVDWSKISKDDPDAWLYFYEGFLQTYDRNLRKQTGSYYTPVEVVRSMAGLVDEALTTHLNLPGGFKNPAVTVVDPAMGTGTFLLEIVRLIAERISADQGPGAVGPALEEALKRIIGFELQLGPFAVAQLRLLAELAAFGSTEADPSALRTYVTNTLDDPFVEESSLGSWYQPITDARRAANKAKAEENILVVIGNPPYKEKSRGRGGWIEQGSEGTTRPIEDFFPDREWNVGTHTKHLYNAYVYFWRWATWKVFDHHEPSDRGVVCFITVAGFLNGQGFQGMRRYLRATSDEIWVIDCSPEGFTPPVSSRVFEAMRHEVCITLAVRTGATSRDEPAPVHYRELAPGHRRDKFVELEKIRLQDDAWETCSTEWRAPFLPQSEDDWASYPALDDLFRYSGSGTMPGRTWVIDPDVDTLKERWNTLITTTDRKRKKELMQEHKRDRHIDKKLSDGLPGFPYRRSSIAEESQMCAEPIQIAFRSFDRQRIIPDKRVINQPNPTLWSTRSDEQMWLTAPESESPTSGPALTAAALIPDLHHYAGRGGRAYPLWLDAEATVGNIIPGLLEELSRILEQPVNDKAVFAYVAAVTAHGGYTEKFSGDLGVPGIRVPVTADDVLFRQAVELGKRVLWLHSYGTRFVDESQGRPANAPRLPEDLQPKVPVGGTIPTTVETMPDGISYDPLTHQLHVGAGRISNVTQEMWDYEISGTKVIRQWFSYRQKDRTRPVIGDRKVSRLMKINSDRWRPEYTSQLLDLLNLLGLLIELETDQRELLAAIVDHPLITVHDLHQAGILPIDPAERSPKKVILAAHQQAGTLFR